MNLENLQEDGVAERVPVGAARTSAQLGGAYMGLDSTTKEIVAFKFGGSSLLGADRMLHAAKLVHAAAQTSVVTVVVSAMKDVTDHLLSIVQALADGKLSHARREAEVVLQLHLDVLCDLQLKEDQELSVRRGLQTLGRDLLHEVPQPGNSSTCQVAATAELF